MGENKKQAHQALYRKYRPKSLQEVVGQEHITDVLANAISQNKINHAYLFTGPRGTGKTSIARIMAHEINQLKYVDGANQLDIIEIDAASNRRIDDIRELREKVHIAPVNAAYKVYIIDEVHMLTAESFNALLKTLEEPPSHVIFILATTEIQKLPATILSRVQRHSFRLIDTTKVADHLAVIAEKESIDINKAAIKLLAEHGGGSFRDSISLLDQLSAHSASIDEPYVEQLLGVAPKELIGGLLKTIEASDSASALRAVEDLIASGLTPQAIATEVMSHIRSAIYSGEDKPYYLALMEELMSISGAPYKQLKLESVLLKVISQRNPAIKEASKAKVSLQQVAQIKRTDSLKSAEKDAKPIKRSKPATETSKEPEVPLKKEAEVAEQSDSTEEKQSNAGKNNDKPIEDILSTWQKILEALKKKHNPLYTLLRVSAPSISDDTLTLSFSFAFHKKKLEDPKYKALLAETVFEITNKNVAIESVVDKNKAGSAGKNQPSDPAHASQISAVRDMMGGGDIVDV